MARSGPVGSKSSRVTDSAGTNAEMKKDGYAKGPVPKSMIGTKPGKTDKVGYSGPNVQHGGFD